ncbi:nuclear factor related to kappa-B-binding protein-like isoform X1 [Cydia pomonella]|uniref:nuclear factor related to kappa-B-binding protein-like isoform X1 n=1 Tax=Cydia pomonella TaxID=82600 RepID=UPI002ADDCF76|nr:nuclear factor related to kappa-B-binding protein-like isoform X1 [Cydia pomonella]
MVETMSGGLVEKVYIGLDHAPAAFDIKGRILGPNGTNIEYIRSETGVLAVLKSEKFEPLHLALHHTRSEALAAARSLALNLIETIRAELAQWSAQQAGGPPPPLNVPPPTLATTTAPPPVPPPVATVALSTPSTLTSPAHQTVIPPVVSVAQATTPLMTVRQPTVLQLLQPQQQYVLNQENGQLIPIVQPGVQVSNAANFTHLPIAQHLGSLQQPNFGGTQIVDLSSMQPVNVTQLRLSGVPSSMSMILPNGLSFPQASLTSSDTTTVSSATATPVVCAAQSTNASQKILYSTDKGDKDVKYHIQGDTVQWTMPGSQTMLIPYQQLQDLTANQALPNLQPQQFVSIAPAGGLPQTSLPLSAAQFQQLQATGTIMHLNQKPIVSSGSLINIISTGQASSPQVLSNSSTPTKNMNQESRGQKRLSDGTPSQLQLRPIAPAGSQGQDKSSTRDSRTWTTAARENTVVSMGMKINPAHGTIIHVSSGQQTNVSGAGVTQENTGMYIRQMDRNAIQIQNKDKQDPNKLQNQNVQMITVPQGMTVLQNPLNISQMPMIGQHNNQVYMIPANQHNIVQGGLPPGLIGQQVLQPGQNVTVMQPNQLAMPNGVQYNMPLMQMNLPPNSHYMPAGINLNTQLSAQQLNAALAGQQLTNPSMAVSGAIPLVQAPPPASPMAQTNPPTQQPVHQIMPQNSTFITPTSQYAGMPAQYMMQTNSGAIVPANNPVQYTVPANQSANPPANNGNGQSNTPTENESTNGTNQTNYITSSSQENYAMTQNQQQMMTNDGAATQTLTNQQTQQSYTTNGSNPQTYNVNQTTTTQPPATYQPTNGSNPQANTQNYAASTPISQAQNYSPSTTPAPNQTYPATNLPNMPNVAFPPNQTPNPYPNATGQNMAAYANNQYQYTSRPWFRPRYGSPQGSPYGAGAPAGPPMPVPPPAGNYNYWQDS